MVRADRGIYMNGLVRLPGEASSRAGVPHLIGVGYVST